MTSLPPAVLSVLELFKGPLASVRFADVDAEGLATLAAEVESAALEVENQEAKLTELRQSLGQAQESLLLLAQRALAYARVYAENNDELSEELNQISLPRAQKPRKQPAPKSSSTVAAAAVEQSESTPEAEAVGEGEPAREVELELDAESTEAASVGPSERKAKKKGPLRTAREANAAASE